MANTFVSATVVAKRAVQMLVNELVVGSLVHRQYVKEFTGNERTGGSVTILAPMYARVKDGATLDNVELNERSFTLSATSRKHVAHYLSSQEMTYNIDGWSERIIKPAMVALANKIEVDVLALAKKFPCQVGTPGTTPNSFLTFAQANQRLSEQGTPLDGNRNVVVSPAVTAVMTDNLKALFHREIVGNAVERSKLPVKLAGMNTYESNNVYTHTCGTQAGVAGMLVDEGVALTDGETALDMDACGSAATLTAGDIFTIANVYAVNPISGQSTGSLRQFVVDTAATAAATQFTAVEVTPGTSPYQMYASTATEKVLPYQNMSAYPADGAAVTVAGTASLQHPLNLAFHRDAMALVTVPLTMPQSVSWGSRANYNGISIRVVKDYDVTNDREYIRFDVLYGVGILNPWMGVRIAG